MMEHVETLRNNKTSWIPATLSVTTYYCLRITTISYFTSASTKIAIKIKGMKFWSQGVATIKIEYIQILSSSCRSYNRKPSFCASLGLEQAVRVCQQSWGFVRDLCLKLYLHNTWPHVLGNVVYELRKVYFRAALCKTTAANRPISCNRKPTICRKSTCGKRPHLYPIIRWLFRSLHFLTNHYCPTE